MTAGLEESARLAGSHCWSERRMFEILGTWVSSTTETEVKLMLDRHAQNHAWRAAQWWDRLPVLADVERDGLVRAPSAAAEKAMGLVEEAVDTVARLAGAYRFAIPRMFAAYGQHRAVANPVSDGSALRTLNLAGPDLASDWAEGEIALQGLLISAADAERASGTVSRLEGLLLAR